MSNYKNLRLPGAASIIEKIFAGVFYIAEDIDRNTFVIDGEIIPQLPSASKKLIALNRDAYKSQAKDIYTSLKSLDSETSWPHLHVCRRCIKCINIYFNNFFF